MKTAVVKHKQSLPDIAIQVYGELEGLFELAQLNNLCITDILQPGNKLIYTSNNNRIAGYFKGKQHYPATGFSDKDELIKEGIDYWFLFEYVVQ